ncbi:MAG TPA: TIGR03936 family radical SAM-associated protein [Natronosporangium sp.]|nr:TIGR03936 family radical SAM-associated protein [Natronosporangium sp.]
MVQRIRVRYAKRGPLRFTSHRDVARAFERALRRAGVPVAYSQGFSPHPRISYASAAPTGAASEAEYLELALQQRREPRAVAAALDAALSPGLDVIEAVEAATPGGLAERLEASRWRIDLPGVEPDTLRHAVTAFLAADEVVVERTTRQGRRRVDVRAAVVSLAVVDEKPASTAPAPPAAAPGRPGSPSVAAPVRSTAPSGVADVPCAILDCVVRQVTPSVRPDDVLSGLRVVADLLPPVPSRATRLAQGMLTAQGEIQDPLEADRGGAPTESFG